MRTTSTPPADEAGDERGFEFGGGVATVIADRHARAAGRADAGGEASADRDGIGGAERFADDPADVVFAERGRVELVGHFLDFRSS